LARVAAKSLAALKAGALTIPLAAQIPDRDPLPAG
jgi:hypothetical protein